MERNLGQLLSDAALIASQPGYSLS